MKRRSGFTLIEILIVLGLMAVFASFAVAVSIPAIRTAELDRIRETVRNELVAAQADTIGGTLDSSWGVAFSSNTITRYRGASYATRVTSYDRVTSLDDAFSLSGATDVPFSRPTGLPTSATAVVMTSNNLQATTTITAAGVISVQ